MTIVAVRTTREPAESNIRAIIRPRIWKMLRIGTRGPASSRAIVLLSASLAIASGACDSPHPEAASPIANPGATPVEPGSPELTGEGGRGQTIYAPAYSAIAIADNAQLYQLATTLSIRNTDRTLPIVITAIRYHHQDGRLVRDMLKTPLRVAPMASLEFFIREGDTSGGTASSFLIDWVAQPAVSPPIVETVMAGTSGTQGISFTCTGRVVAERGP
jgi:hypothetical protein